MKASLLLRGATFGLAVSFLIAWNSASALAQAQPQPQPAKGDGAAGAQAPPARTGEPKSNLIRSLMKMLDDEGAASSEEKQRVRDMLMDADAELARSGGANLMKTIMDANKKPVGFRVGGTKSRRRSVDGAAPQKPGEEVKPAVQPKPVAPVTPAPVTPAPVKPTTPAPPKKTPEVEDPFAVPEKQ